MRSRMALTSADARKMVEASRTMAQKNNWNVSIAIVDDAGNVLHLERGDGASPITAEVALGKAQASAALRVTSKAAADLLKDFPGMLKVPAGIPMQGAVPVMFQGECVGAIGVSGGLAQDDEQVAAAGAKALT